MRGYGVRELQTPEESLPEPLWRMKVDLLQRDGMVKVPVAIAKDFNGACAYPNYLVSDLFLGILLI